MATQPDVLHRQIPASRTRTRFWLAQWCAVLLLGLSSIIQAATIQCPLPEAHRTITNPLPQGWWTTPIVNRLSAVRVGKIGGKPTLICEYGASGSIQRRAPTGETCKAVGKGFSCQAAGASAAGACAATVQGKIAWNYEGNKRWSPANIAKLCGSAQNSTQPAMCFNRVMHGGISWGGGTQWKWQNAITLCSGSRDARATIGCFQQGVKVGKRWDEAAQFCSP